MLNKRDKKNLSEMKDMYNVSYIENTLRDITVYKFDNLRNFNQPHQETLLKVAGMVGGGINKQQLLEFLGKASKHVGKSSVTLGKWGLKGSVLAYKKSLDIIFPILKALTKAEGDIDPSILGTILQGSGFLVSLIELLVTAYDLKKGKFLTKKTDPLSIKKRTRMIKNLNLEYNEYVEVLCDRKDSKLAEFLKTWGAVQEEMGEKGQEEEEKGQEEEEKGQEEEDDIIAKVTPPKELTEKLTTAFLKKIKGLSRNDLLELAQKMPPDGGQKEIPLTGSEFELDMEGGVLDSEIESLQKILGEVVSASKPNLTEDSKRHIKGVIDKMESIMEEKTS